ncbi:GNAT family N-acetyltransferase [Enterococcus sp. BWR-S5]|uniref:GNAT family N-acetyltransferase n=1 Tax=Enterococcus sp. BWR-S5 TaxID=2787714 RepID=UPI001921FFAC|nr:GNAT family N-acetyltransferase [Enterococcus sp. BWR-S5]MBL1225419.1 GNAT family N-acetyltransferase [Enterococcus sp. BWR-S5]
MEFKVKTLAELTSAELLAIMKERIAVFVVEQHCPYQEADELDETALHTWLQEGTELVGYTRIIEEDDAIHIGRVLTVKKYRGAGYGELLMKKTLEAVREHYPNQSVVLGAQEYATAFYEKFGFKVISDVYLEDDIPHVDMQLGE